MCSLACCEPERAPAVQEHWSPAAWPTLLLASFFERENLLQVSEEKRVRKGATRFPTCRGLVGYAAPAQLLLAQPPGRRRGEFITMRSAEKLSA
jgi:hypothetical protein